MLYDCVPLPERFRVRALREFLDYVKRFDGVWWATREVIADWYLANHKQHIG